MTDTESLEVAVRQYEEQLSQVEIALSTTTSGTDRDNLLSLRSDIRQLISLTKENLQSVSGTNIENANKSETIINRHNDPMEEEYALFKAELEAESRNSENAERNKSTSEAVNDIEDELKALEGMKCRAPHGSNWGGTGYHNAMVCSVHRTDDKVITSMNDIQVRVLFVNPTHKEMLPCPYFLDGACKFSDEQCHYSHGEIVPLVNLQEYREPDFSSIKMGSRVLTKQKNNLWHRSVVLKLPETEGDMFRVKFEASGNIVEIDLHDLLPLDDADLELSDSSDDSECETEVAESNAGQLIHQSLLTTNPDEPLGGWERHTRGMGSKLMARMGYVFGTGLGRRSDGRVEPVEATVLPAGKSLDHCMELRESAGGDKNLFSAERKMRKQQRKLEEQREKQYQREIQKEKKNVFNFINSTLGDKPKDSSQASGSKSANLKAESTRNLNVASFQIGQNIARLERESLKLRESLGRHIKGDVHYSSIVSQYNEKQKEITDLRASEKLIADEQSQRRIKEKLSVF